MQPPERFSMAPSARSIAVRQLLRIEEEGAFVGFMDSESDGDERTDRQATEYVAGVTRWRRWLDFLAASFYRGRFDKMEPELRQILRIGLYDLLFLDTPPHAALHEAVDLAKQRVRPRAGGLVNAILRNVQRRRQHLPEPSSDDPADDLAIRWSHPTWLVRRWLAQFGASETRALLAWNNERPVHGVRINRLKISVPDFQRRLDELEIAWEPSPFIPYFVRVPRLQPLLQAEMLAEGLCAVQDESAGLVTVLADPQPGATVADLCAAPGGKALHAADRMRDEGRIHAYDVHAARLGLVASAAERQGVSIVTTTAADVRALTAADIQADLVLLDAPCSGLGVLAKRADLRWNRTPEDLAQLIRLQQELLAAAAPLVRPGGVLVYSTCSIDTEENETQVRDFLQVHPDFDLDPAGAGMPASVVEQGMLASFPQRHFIDGAFGARLRRRESGGA